MVSAVLVGVFEIELLGRKGVALAEEGEYRIKRLLPYLFDLCLSVGILRADRAYQAGGLSQAEVEIFVDLRGRGRLEGLGHRVLGDDAVLADDVDEHVPLTAVADAGREDVVDRPVAVGKGGRVDDRVDEVVGSFEFVPERQMRLGEFEGIKVLLLRDDLAKQVGRREEPAASG